LSQRAGNFGRLEDGGAAGDQKGDLTTAHLRTAFDVLGVQHPNSRISREVIDVEGEDARDGVDVHSGYEAGIMDVYAGYAVGADEIVPLAMGCGAARSAAGRWCQRGDPSPLRQIASRLIASSESTGISGRLSINCSKAAAFCSGVIFGLLAGAANCFKRLRT